MAAADVAMWLAIMTRLGAHDGSVTAGMTSAFLGAARRESFRCTARIVKLGGRLVFGVAESVGAGGRLLAHHSLTYARAKTEVPGG
jgi:acyl-coenzyme A thioesterase PaaI-like protein